MSAGPVTTADAELNSTRSAAIWRGASFFVLWMLLMQSMKPADLMEYAAFNQEFAATMQAAKKAGRTVDEMAASWKIPAKYQGYAPPADVRLKSNIQIVFDETK